MCGVAWRPPTPPSDGRVAARRPPPSDLCTCGVAAPGSGRVATARARDRCGAADGERVGVVRVRAVVGVVDDDAIVGRRDGCARGALLAPPHSSPRRPRAVMRMRILCPPPRPRPPPLVWWLGSSRLVSSGWVSRGRVWSLLSSRLVSSRLVSSRLVSSCLARSRLVARLVSSRLSRDARDRLPDGRRQGEHGRHPEAGEPRGPAARAPGPQYSRFRNWRFFSKCSGRWNFEC